MDKTPLAMLATNKAGWSREQRHAAHAVARMPKKIPPASAEHLQIQQQDAVTHTAVPGKAHLLQAGDAQDGEQNQS